MDATGGVNRPSTELIRYYPEQDLGATYNVPLLESDSPTIQNPGDRDDELIQYFEIV